MKSIIFLFLILTGVSYGQDEVLDYAEVEPQFPGGTEAMIKWISERIEYPAESRDLNEQGIVYVQFVVAKSGWIQDVVIIKGVSERLDAESRRLILRMPRWEPGKNNGSPVNTKYTIPIKFSLG